MAPLVSVTSQTVAIPSHHISQSRFQVILPRNLVHEIEVVYVFIGLICDFLEERNFPSWGFVFYVCDPMTMAPWTWS